MTLEPYQEDAAAWLSKLRRGLVTASAGAGKTILGAAAVDKVLRAKPRTRPARIGVICNTREQVDQWQAAFDKFESINRLAFLKIACAAACSDWSGVDCLLVDEAHHSTAPEWTAQILTCKGALWGVTATPEMDDEIRDKALLAMFDGKVFNIPREAVKGRLVPAKVIILDASDDIEEMLNAEIAAETKTLLRRFMWSEQSYLKNVIVRSKDPAEKAEAQRKLDEIHSKAKMMAAWQSVASVGIAHNEARNAAAVAAARRHLDKHVLLLVNHTEHGENLVERIGDKAMLCHSKMGIKKRRAAMDAFRSGVCRCLVATSLADEGLDLPLADVLVLVSGGRSKVKATQRTGRVLRSFSGKSHGIIYDFADNRHRLTAKHAKARIDLYRSLGYEVTGAVSTLL